MNTYEEIIERIIEIIDLSKNINNVDCTTINHFVIANEFVEEFKELLDSEKTFYSLGNDLAAFKKNYELICQCKKYIEDNFDNDYLEVINILEQSYGESVDELIEYFGYYIRKQDLNDFSKLCKKLRIGPSILLKDCNPEIIKSEIYENLNKNKEQYNRIKTYLIPTTNDIKEENNNINENSDELDNQENLPLLLKGNFKELIYLGIKGYLTIEMVVDLKNVLSKQQFQELVNRLLEFKIFNRDDINQIEKLSQKNIRMIDNINELVVYFAIRKDIDIKALKVLVPYIGIENYHYLVDQLYRFDAIDYDDYKEYLEEFNFIESDKNKKRV